MPPHERVIDLDVADRTDQVTPAVQTYTVFAGCNNCDYEGEAELPKGVKVDEAVCPQCTCVELVRRKQPGEDARKEPEPRPAEPSPEEMAELREQLAEFAREQRARYPFGLPHPVAPNSADPMAPAPIIPAPSRPILPQTPDVTPGHVTGPATWTTRAQGRQNGRPSYLFGSLLEDETPVVETLNGNQFK